ncbi:MAG: hypothetical protein A2X59_02445 [Nitrospirae bacterium GWC2_42_7]|nr:MAG: hypothetical protein A2X59_02445 [Nitrospirae bacterium GWC2_42_7]
MIKYPEPGMVKTRLARDIGPQKAALISRQITERVMKQTMPFSGEYGRLVFYDPPERIQEFVAWLQNEKFISQKGGDVGERMDNAIRHLLENGAGKAVITGADIPDLTSEIIIQAFDILDGSDVVIGPAHDGGYYLIGMKFPLPELFCNITWSTSDVFAETIRTLKHLGKSYSVLPLLSDLDTIEDLDNIVK